MREAFEDLIEFETACGHPPSDVGPAVPEARVQALRMALHGEEFEELQTAMAAGDLPGIADGLGDLIYVLNGTAVRYGIDLPAVFAAIHKANMTKANGPRRADGKLMKPPGFKHPDISGILMTQRPLAETYGKGA